MAGSNITEGYSPTYTATVDIVLLGDYNCVCCLEDRARSDVPLDTSARFLSELVDQCDLIDVEKNYI